MRWAAAAADDRRMNINRTLLSLSVLAATGFGVLAASPIVSAQEKVCIHRSLQLRDHRSEGDTEYFYYEEVCDGWMETGPKDPEPPKDDGDGGGKQVPMTREEECEARKDELNQMEQELRWADDQVLFLEAVVRGYDVEETDAERAASSAAADAQAADVALAAAQAAYTAAGYETTRTRLVKGEEVDFYVGYDVSTAEGRAVVVAQAAQRDAALKLAQARWDRAQSNLTSAAEADSRNQLDSARSILATYPMRIEQLRREFNERC